MQTCPRCNIYFPSHIREYCPNCNYPLSSHLRSNSYKSNHHGMSSNFSGAGVVSFLLRTFMIFVIGVSFYTSMQTETLYTTQIVVSGSICADGWKSPSTGRGTCSHHGGVSHANVIPAGTAYEVEPEGFVYEQSEFLILSGLFIFFFTFSETYKKKADELFGTNQTQ